MDILLNQTVAVLVLENSSLSGDQYQGDDSGGGDDDETEEIPGPPASKQLRRVSSEHDPCEKVQTGKCSKSPLLHFTVLDQIIAETITNPFTQLRSRSLSGWFITTFGCTLWFFCMIQKMMSFYSSYTNYLFGNEQTNCQSQLLYRFECY